MNRDEALLAEAYEQVLEGKFGTGVRTGIAAAGLGLAGLHGADMDTVNKDYKLDAPKHEQPAVSAATDAYEKFRRGEQLTPAEVIALSNDEQYAKDYIQHLANLGVEMPEVLAKKYPEVIRRAIQIAKQSGSGG